MVVDEDEAEAPREKGRVRAWLEKHRTRLAQVALVVFLVAVLLEISAALPRDVEVAFRFEDHGAVERAQVTYLQEDEVVREVTLGWPDGAPALVRDTVELSPGDYDVFVLLTRGDGETSRLRGRLTAPADGVVRVRLRR